MPPEKLSRRQVRWARSWMTLVLAGFMLFVLGIDPGLFGLDRSPVVGFIQMGVWLVGLAMVLLGAYLAVRVVRNGRKPSLRSDIGLRLMATGYVVSLTASLADFLGIGSHHLPNLFFGPVQVMGLIVGIAVSFLGLLLYWPRRRTAGPPSP
jgi:hypothetical protein